MALCICSDFRMPLTILHHFSLSRDRCCHSLFYSNNFLEIIDMIIFPLISMRHSRYHSKNFYIGHFEILKGSTLLLLKLVECSHNCVLKLYSHSSLFQLIHKFREQAKHIWTQCSSNLPFSLHLIFILFVLYNPSGHLYSAIPIYQTVICSLCLHMQVILYY